MAISRSALKIRRWLLIVMALLLLVTGALTTFDFQLLCVTSRLQPADAIVVLGGEPIVRVQAAAKLVSNGFAPRVIISGSGDCQENRRLIEELGVRASSVNVECESKTTQENAQLTAKLLREHGCKQVIIVTSWFHSRRALNTFRRYAPEIRFMSAPVERTKPWRYERNYIMAEYAKTAWYAVRYGIWPVTSN